eukprot:11209203-Lingulodinium_polyedra.AAC.1
MGPADQREKTRRRPLGRGTARPRKWQNTPKARGARTQTLLRAAFLGAAPLRRPNVGRTERAGTGQSHQSHLCA